MLRQRAELLQRTRAFFEKRNFIEVETPLLSRETIVDRHLDPMRVTMADAAKPWFLQTSPELHMKRLLSETSEAIYQITRSFRGGEQGPLHNPEFTIVEWYRPGDDMQQGMELLSQLSEALLHRGPAKQISYREAFFQFAGIDPLVTTKDDLRAFIEKQEIATTRSETQDDRDTWLDLILVERVQPHLGLERPTILFDYPASQAALARVRQEDPPVAERFELIIDGIELANGYQELLDAEELSRRNDRANEQRIADGKEPLPEPRLLLDAMRHGLPSCTGCALGLDRVLMLATGATRLDEVLPFPAPRA